MQCAAKCKATGEQCRRRAVNGKRVCTVHGGLTPSGSASVHFKSGRYSRHLPARLAERYHKAQADQRLLELREEIALIDARLCDLLATEDWEQIYRVIEQRRRLVDSENLRLIEARQMLSVEQAMLMISALTDIIRTHVTDKRILQLSPPMWASSLTES